MRYSIILFALLFVSCNNNENDVFKPKIGDILFQDLDSSPLCDAIELVTNGYKNANLSHIGIVIEGEIPFCNNADERFEEKYFYNLSQDVKILESIPNKVTITTLDSFLNRSFDINNNPKVIVGRLKPKYQHTIADAISFLKGKIGEKYDDAFMINNNTYYCSELIYEAFKKDSIFKLNPMTFLHPETKDTLKIWKEYYSKIGIRIPQNKLGINPGGMSLSEKIDIIHIYGNPKGMGK